ncbi:hypothetical protein CBP52_00735 [Cellulomonas sp. PSBB021]|nr:hypothetical protein CBP52_00735 [Cellulomonas sp. PSBB021]
MEGAAGRGRWAVTDELSDLLAKATVRINVGGELSGTGFVVAPGKVLTCHHVVKRALDRTAGHDLIDVVLDAGAGARARPVTRPSVDETNDLALLTLDTPCPGSRVRTATSCTARTCARVTRQARSRCRGVCWRTTTAHPRSASTSASVLLLGQPEPRRATSLRKVAQADPRVTAAAAPRPVASSTPRSGPTDDVDALPYWIAFQLAANAVAEPMTAPMSSGTPTSPRPSPRCRCRPPAYTANTRCRRLVRASSATSDAHPIVTANNPATPPSTTIQRACRIATVAPTTQVCSGSVIKGGGLTNGRMAPASAVVSTALSSSLTTRTSPACGVPVLTSVSGPIPQTRSTTGTSPPANAPRGVCSSPAQRPSRADCASQDAVRTLVPATGSVCRPTRCCPAGSACSTSGSHRAVSAVVNVTDRPALASLAAMTCRRKSPGVVDRTVANVAVSATTPMKIVARTAGRAIDASSRPTSIRTGRLPRRAADVTAAAIAVRTLAVTGPMSRTHRSTPTNRTIVPVVGFVGLTRA